MTPELPVRSQDEQEEDEEGAREDEQDKARDMKDAWIDYVGSSPCEEEKFCCVWKLRKERDGPLEPCGYQAKKYLVKRHIESKHLQLRFAAPQLGHLLLVSEYAR